MFLVLVTTDVAGARCYLPRFSGVTPLAAERLEMAATTDLQQAQFFRATPMTMYGETVLRLQPAPPPGPEDWQAYTVSLWL
jgi:hypothetical protein